MINNFFLFYEENILFIYLVHIIISLILAFVLSQYLSKRFLTHSEEIDIRDIKRTRAISLRSWLYKRIFVFSLHKNNRKTNFVFLFILNLTIPLIGYIYSIWIAWWLRNVSYEKKVVNTNMLNLDEFYMSFLKVERIFGEGSMSNLMKNKYAPKSKKLKALSSLASNISPVNLKVVRETLTSTDDEIRMFGYAVINKAEKLLNQKINKQLSIMHSLSTEEKDEKKIAYAAKELAFLYWEMVYTELSHESLKNNFLNSTITYIELSKEYFTSQIQTNELLDEELAQAYQVCSSLYMLMGRVHMSRNKFELAIAEFTVAQELLPEKATFILPYLAEAYYMMGKYSITKSLLKEADGLNLNATLYPIVEQWKAA